MREILVATSNQGKLRDLNALAAPRGVRIAGLPGIEKLPVAREDAPTFEANAAKKAEYYSRWAGHEYLLADDSGLAVDALGGAPGVHSARYALLGTAVGGNADDAANNERLLRELDDVPDEGRTARFVCSLAVARNGRLVACFRGAVEGLILREARGSGGFGYDPLFYVASRQRTFGELPAAEKGELSHRGIAFRKFLDWFAGQP